MTRVFETVAGFICCGRILHFRSPDCVDVSGTGMRAGCTQSGDGRSEGAAAVTPCQVRDMKEGVRLPVRRQWLEADVACVLDVGAAWWRQERPGIAARGGQRFSPADAFVNGHRGRIRGFYRRNRDAARHGQGGRRSGLRQGLPGQQDKHQKCGKELPHAAHKAQQRWKFHDRRIKLS
jgi:hypothetical protein